MLRVLLLLLGMTWNSITSASKANNYIRVLTYADCCQHAHALVRRVALGEEGLCRIDGEGEGDDGLGARPHYHALHPQSDEGQERSEGDHDVGVVRPSLFDHAPELCVAVGTDHGEDAGDDPDHEGHVDRPGLLQHSRGGDKDAGADDGSNDDGAAIEQGHLGLELHRLVSSGGLAPAVDNDGPGGVLSGVRVGAVGRGHGLVVLPSHFLTSFFFSFPFPFPAANASVSHAAPPRR